MATKRPSISDALKQHDNRNIPPPAAIETPDGETPKPRRRNRTPKATAVDSEGRKLVGFYLRPEAHRQIKIMAVEEDTNSSALVREALNDYFRKRGKPVIS